MVNWKYGGYLSFQCICVAWLARARAEENVLFSMENIVTAVHCLSYTIPETDEADGDYEQVVHDGEEGDVDICGCESLYPAVYSHHHRVTDQSKNSDRYSQSKVENLRFSERIVLVHTETFRSERC